jgi:hypothetical protein
MVSELLLALGLLQPASLTPEVAVEAAYALVAGSPEVAPEQCCGLCKNGIVTHGDGHTTECRCPSDCKCKTKGAVVHPPSVIRSCPGGTCKTKPSK